MNMQLTYNQAYDIIERALYWNKSNPDFFYSQSRRPHIFSIAVAAVCENFNDISMENRKDLVNLFIEAYKQFALVDIESRNEDDFDEDSFRELILNDYS